MNLYTVNHGFHYELENLTRAFFVNEKITVTRFDTAVSDLQSPFILTEMTEDELKVQVQIDDFQKTLTSPFGDDNELIMATLLYNLLCEYTGINLKWGLLTGVRPIKLLRRLKESMGEKGAVDYFEKTLLVSDEKSKLAQVTCVNEQKILDITSPESFSLYVSIPFCPSRCSYCSFVSQSVEKARHLIPEYVRLLCKEIELTAQIVKQQGLKLETVYIGGGTPTSLEAQDLSLIMNTINDNFDMTTCREFTVEAGRPDTITEEKLVALKEGGCDRLSVNPQTLSDSVLENIGRRHTVQDFYDSFHLARKVGFTHINTDLIAGLPGDNPSSFLDTMSGICKLDPESVTVHTLSMKRSSHLTGSNLKLMREDANAVAAMLENGYSQLEACGFAPYYLYRQSKMVGNMENTGWSKPGFEGIYNVYIMDETHTILACGAGAVTKLRDPYSDCIERIFNFKYPYEYNARFEELMERKDAIGSFYSDLLT